MASGFIMERRKPQTKVRTQKERESALFQMLVLRASIDTLTADDLARSSGVRVDKCAAMLEAERNRRKLRA